MKSKGRPVAGPPIFVVLPADHRGAAAIGAANRFPAVAETLRISAYM
jgi:hypothetical protein